MMYIPHAARNYIYIFIHMYTYIQKSTLTRDLKGSKNAGTSSTPNGGAFFTPKKGPNSGSNPPF